MRKEQSAWHVVRRQGLEQLGKEETMSSEVPVVVRTDPEQGFSTIARWTFWAGYFFAVGLSYVIVGFLTASLASKH